jgi:hypothetical protein
MLQEYESAGCGSHAARQQAKRDPDQLAPAPFHAASSGQ